MKIIAKDYLRIARKTQRCIGNIVKEYDITVAEQPFAMLLYKEDDVTQEQLTEEAGVDKALTARIIKSLEKKGMIVKRKDERDKRNNRIYRTDLLKEKVERIFPELMLLNDYLMEGISTEDQEIFIKVLERLEANVSKLYDERRKDEMCNE